jgi:phosphoadenosine phosphosulfate reductase
MMPMSDTVIRQLALEMGNWSPDEILSYALEQFERIGISFSGAEDVLLVDMAARLRAGVQVFSLDTGRLHPETYRLFEEVRDRYDVNFELLCPEPAAIEALVREKGLFSFYRDGHKECCALRKVAPLRGKLRELDAWITGQRKDQSLDTRAALAVVQRDEAFSSPTHPVVKFNPLANWTSAEVWAYIRANDVPFNALHQRGFVSIGCEPCTRPVLPNQHERDGRWWWETAKEKECGLHTESAKTASLQLDGEKP